MKAGILIQAIEAASTHVIRHPVLRKGHPLESCIFDGDELASTLHLGAYLDEKLVGVLSAYEKQHPAFDEKHLSSAWSGCFSNPSNQRNWTFTYAQH